MMEDAQFVYRKIIQAPVDLIYRAFTSATSLREWLCNVSTTNPEVGGRLYLAWSHGYFASGCYLELVPNQFVAFSWIGRDEPKWTRVEVSLTPNEDQDHVLVELRHSGLVDGPDWAAAREEIDKGWKLGLDNLKSTLEEGMDLRIVNRPLLGIYPEEIANLNLSEIQALNLPVDSGVFVNNVVPDYGAAQAGILPDDVIVAIGGDEVDSLKTLSLILNQYQPGDVIDVDVFRNAKKLTFHVNTTPQIAVNVPNAPEELAKKLEADSLDALNQLEEVLRGVSDIEASFSPGPEEWSSKETLAHLIHSERDMHGWISDLVSGQERFYDEWPGDRLFRIRATITSYPQIDDLMAELRRSMKETVASVAFIDLAFTRRKASYRRLALDLLNNPLHLENHIQQIRANIEAARAAQNS